MSNPLTLGREACWNAINNDAALNPLDVSVFRLKLRFDDDTETPADWLTSIDDFPSIALVPLGMEMDWDSHRMQEWPYGVNIAIFTAVDLPQAEQLIYDTIRALWKACPDGSSVPYVKAATGYYPKDFGRVSFKRLGVGTNRGTQAQMVACPVFLHLQVDPLA